MPVTIVSQTNVPQSSSSCQAASTICAACSGVGGRGSGAGLRGLRATVAGLVLIQSHRTAAASVALIVPWMLRILDAARGLQLWGGHSTTSQPIFVQS